MKIDRLLGIITVLLQQDKVTAPELAAKFEVSRRTIQRDVDDICKAGIPVVTYQGADGGIAIADGFKIDKTVISVDERQNIIAGLKGIASISNISDISKLIAKLSPKNTAKLNSNSNVVIDLSSHYKGSLSDKITLLKKAIAENKLVSFSYYSDKGCSSRVIEPYLVIYKWSAWYVYGYCKDKADYRLFKLNRLWDLVLSGEYFGPKEISTDDMDLDNYFSNEIQLLVLFNKEVEYLLVEEYGPNSYEKTEDGRLKLSICFTNREYLKRWILSFGDKVEVIEPVEFRKELSETAKSIEKLYERDI